jgi:pectin methylesterase-like acyl-CoA thioesterase
MTVTVQNKRVDTVFFFDIGYQLDNNTPVIVTSHYPSTPLLTGTTYDYTFSNPVVVTKEGNFKIKTWVANMNNNYPDDDPSNDTVLVTACTGMSGKFTIGPSGADYPNIGSAINAIQQCGISGPIVFTVAPGTYTGRIIIPEIAWNECK